MIPFLWRRRVTFRAYTVHWQRDWHQYQRHMGLMIMNSWVSGKLSVFAKLSTLFELHRTEGRLGIRRPGCIRWTCFMTFVENVHANECYSSPDLNLESCNSVSVSFTNCCPSNARWAIIFPKKFYFFSGNIDYRPLFSLSVWWSIFIKCVAN